MSMKIEGFENVVLKEFRVFQREGKATLYFAEFVDSTNFQSTGEMLFLGDEKKAFDIASLKLKPVDVVLQMSLFNGRASINVIDIQPSKMAKVG